MLVHFPGHVPSSVVTLQSASFVQKTVFTHSDGSELGDCDGYEHTSISAAPAGRSAVATQHCACVSPVRQPEPPHLLALRLTAANGSATKSLTAQAVVV